jgi:hypothetical protein
MSEQSCGCMPCACRDESLWRAIIAERDAEITNLRQQLATACTLASKAAEQAQAFATVINETKTVWSE